MKGMTELLLICSLRPARKKARAAAIAETLCLLGDLGARAPAGGPLAEQGGLFWIALPATALEAALARLPWLGHTCAVDLLESASQRRMVADDVGRARARLVRWRGKLYRRVRVYSEDPQALREAAPDRRVFLLETRAGEVRPIQGYRGDSGPTSRRGLPVCDARLLVNLVTGGQGARSERAMFLDPFAGSGGIVLEALARGCRVMSADVDPALRYGLSNMGARHCVADARRLPFATATFDAIATEPPYDRQAESTVLEALHEMRRVLKTSGRLALLCAGWQAAGLRQEATRLGFAPYLDSPIDRKGLDVVVLAWRALACSIPAAA